MKKKTTQETKPVPRKIRGTLEALADDHYTFTPYGEGEPTKIDVTAIGKTGTKTYITVGAKPKRVAHLVVSNDVPDIKSALSDELFKVNQLLPDTAEAQLPEIEPRLILLFSEQSKILGHARLFLDEKNLTMTAVQSFVLKNGENHTAKFIAASTRYAQSLMLNKEKISYLFLRKGGDE